MFRPFSWRLFERRLILTLFIWLIFAVLLVLLIRPAMAQSAPATLGAALSTVDVSALVNYAIELVFAAILGVLVAAIRRGVTLLASMHLLNASKFHADTIDDLMTPVVAWAEAQLEAIVDPALKLQVRGSVVAKAAQMVADQAPAAMAATGITTAGIKAKIEVALGDASAPPPADPAASPNAATPAA